MSAKTAYERTRGKPYAETFRCPGGAPCLDFCNSGQGIRGSRGEEWITSFADLIDWLEAAEAIGAKQASRLRAAGASSPQAAKTLWARAIELAQGVGAWKHVHSMEKGWHGLQDVFTFRR